MTERILFFQNGFLHSLRDYGFETRIDQVIRFRVPTAKGCGEVRMLEVTTLAQPNSYYRTIVSL